MNTGKLILLTVKSLEMGHNCNLTVKRFIMIVLHILDLLILHIMK